MAKSKPINVLLGVMALVAVLAIAPSAFADSTEVDIAKGAGASANADCVSANNCFNPNPVTVAPGSDVEWKNTDTVGHTVTSGKPTDNDAGSVFDSSIIKAGGEFKFTFQNPGTFNYFCQVHPWMTGQVIVSASASSGTSASGSMSSTSMPSTTSASSSATNQTTSPNVAVNDNVTAATTTSTSSPTTSAPTETAPTSTPSTTPSTTESTSSSYSASQSNAAPPSTQSSTSSDEMTGWGVGIAVMAIMSGIGIWSAARRR